MTVRETEIPEGEGRTYAVNRLEGVTAPARPPSTRARGEPAVNETKMSDRCRWCNGKGKVFAHWFGARKTCPECSGSGRRPRPTTEEKQ